MEIIVSWLIFVNAISRIVFCMYNFVVTSFFFNFLFYFLLLASVDVRKRNVFVLPVGLCE